MSMNFATMNADAEHYVKASDHRVIVRSLRAELKEALEHLDEIIDHMYVHDLTGEWQIHHEYDPTEARAYLNRVLCRVDEEGR